MRSSITIRNRISRAPAPPLAIAISLGRKVNLGDYESAEAFANISGVTVATTDAEIAALLNGPGAVAYSALRGALAQQTKAYKQQKQAEIERFKTQHKYMPAHAGG